MSTPRDPNRPDFRGNPPYTPQHDPNDRTAGGQPRHGYTGRLDVPAPTKPPRRWRRALLIGLALLGLVIALAATCGSPGARDDIGAPATAADPYAPPAAEPPAAEPAPAPPASPAAIGDGTYLVGADIEPGTYRSAGAAPGPFLFCSWFTREGAATNSPVIDLGSASEERSPMVVEITDEVGAFESSGCAPWERVQ